MGPTSQDPILIKHSESSGTCAGDRGAPERSALAGKGTGAPAAGRAADASSEAAAGRGRSTAGATVGSWSFA